WNCDRLQISTLQADQPVFLEIGYVVVWPIVMELEKEPSDVRVEETFRNTVGILVMIHMLMMAAMFACPHTHRIFKRAGAKDENEKSNWPAGLEGNVREKPMIT